VWQLVVTIAVNTYELNNIFTVMKYYIETSASQWLIELLLKLRQTCFKYFFFLTRPKYWYVLWMKKLGRIPRALNGI
jgi:hypothetical protein